MVQENLTDLEARKLRRYGRLIREAYPLMKLTCRQWNLVVYGAARDDDWVRYVLGAPEGRSCLDQLNFWMTQRDSPPEVQSAIRRATIRLYVISCGRPLVACA